MKNTTYYFTDPYEYRALESPYCGIESQLCKEEMDRICIYLHWTRDNLPDIPVFGALLTTWELCHVIEAFYGYKKVLIPYNEIRSDFVEINIEANWNNYQSYPNELKRVNQLKAYEIDNALIKMLTILMDHFSSAADQLTSKLQLKQFLTEEVIHKEWEWKNGFNQPIPTLNIELSNYSYYCVRSC